MFIFYVYFSIRYSFQNKRIILIFIEFSGTEHIHIILILLLEETQQHTFILMCTMYKIVLIRNHSD